MFKKLWKLLTFWKWCQACGKFHKERGSKNCWFCNCETEMQNAYERRFAYHEKEEDDFDFNGG